MFIFRKSWGRNSLITLSISMVKLVLFVIPAYAGQGEQKLLITHGFQGKNSLMIEKLVEEFEKEYPNIDVDLTQAGPRNDKHFKSLMRLGVVNELPDISHISLNYVRELKSRNYVKSINKLFEEKDVAESLKISPKLFSSSLFRGEVYSVPFATTVPVVYYNKDLLEKAGVDTSTFYHSWDGIIEAAKKVSDLDSDTVGGYIEYSSTNAWMFQNLLASYGGKLVATDEDKVAFNSFAGVQSLTTLYRLGETMGVDLSQKQARQLFNSGSMGILVRSASGLKSVSQSSKDKFNLGFSQFPITADDGHLVGATNGVVVFNDSPEKQDAIRKYIRFLVGKSGQKILAEETGYIPVSTKFTANDIQSDEGSKINDFRQILISNMKDTTDWFAFPRNSSQIFDVIIDGLRRVVTHEAEPKEEIVNMKNEVQYIINSNISN